MTQTTTHFAQLAVAARQSRFPRRRPTVRRHATTYARVWRTFAVLAAAAVAALVSTPAVFAAAPVNDNFAAAQTLSGSAVDLMSTNKDGTKEVGEPAHAGNAGGASVWFKWTADRTGGVTILTRQITFDTVLGVYTGANVDALTEVASNDDTPGGTTKASRVWFPAVPGTTYYVAVDGFSAAQGPFALRLRHGPVNDAFADAEILADAGGSVQGTTFGATAEAGEQLHGAGGATAWYRWTAPSDGTAGFFADYRRVSVYTGASLEALAEVGTGVFVTFAATAGTEYKIVVESGFTVSYEYALVWGSPPSNDAFANATVLDGQSGQVAATNTFASVETDERGYDSHSVWYRWTAPETGYVRFETVTAFDGVLSAYRGTSLAALTGITRNDDFYGVGSAEDLQSAISFRAIEGQTYRIRVAALWEFEWGSFELAWYPGRIIFASGSGNAITGTAGRDYIYAGGGSDTIHGGGGADIIIGGSGRDRLYGDGGSDELFARDWVRANDVIYGGPGTDSAVKDRGDRMHGVP